TQSGREQRIAQWQRSRGEWNVSTGIRSRADIEAVLAFFYARRGRAHGFRFKDWTDFRAAGQLLGTGDSQQTAFQLVRRYDSGGAVHARRITRPVEGTVVVYRDGMEVSTGLSIDPATGLVTFSTPPDPGVAVTADYEFDVPARFDTDAADLTVETYEMQQWGRITVAEIRE
ncbi:DUF2460 domain-containing protein, partial [Roseovarius tibetensis]|uniref:DUF2460 domain-containing protein n=1 Tax=Roseovarius tibetensis TaxID=2685897 RepID=UPI003D7FB189